MELLNKKELPYGFEYPESIKKIAILDLINLCPWTIIDSKRVKERLNGLVSRYPNRKLIPFAERKDNDDVACFEVGKNNEVQIIHDFASVGWEQVETNFDFYEWFKKAIDEMIEFD